MPAMDVETLIKRAERAETKRASFQALMQDCYAYAMPERDAWNAYGYGQDRQVRVYDSTAIVATARFANRLQDALFPAQQRWARAGLPPALAAVPAAQEVQQDLESLTELMFRHIHASNFDQAVNEWAQDLAAGVGCMLVEDGRLAQRRATGPRLRFQAVPSALVAFDDGPQGSVEGVFFTQRVPARLLRRTYPDASGIPPSIQAMEDGDPDAEMELLQATYFDAEDNTWRFEVVLRQERARIVARKYRTCPWIVTRWTRAPGESHGRGPLTQALPDIRTLNKLTELLLQSASLAVGGVWTALDDGVLNPDTVRIAPGMIIPVGSNGGPRGRSLAPLEFPGSFQLSEIMQDKLRTTIRQILFDDPLPPEVKAGLTATEVTERVRRFQRDTGAFGRLQTDAVMPLVARVLDILDQAGEFADPRFKGLMLAVQDNQVQITATSPLSQAQEQTDVQAVMQVVSGLLSAGPAGEVMLRSAISLDRAGRFVAERAGVPHQLIPTEAELQAQAQAEQAAREEQILAQSPAAAQVAGAVANAAMNPPQEEAPPA